MLVYEVTHDIEPIPFSVQMCAYVRTYVYSDYVHVLSILLA